MFYYSLKHFSILSQNVLLQTDLLWLQCQKYCIFLKRKFAKDISDFFKKDKEETLKALVELKNINILIKNKQKLNYFYYF